MKVKLLRKKEQKHTYRFCRKMFQVGMIPLHVAGDSLLLVPQAVACGIPRPYFVLSPTVLQIRGLLFLPVYPHLSEQCCLHLCRFVLDLHEMKHFLASLCFMFKLKVIACNYLAVDQKYKQRIK